MHNRLDIRILDELAAGGALSVETLTRRMEYRRPASVTTAVYALVQRGRVQRVGASNRFQLSPTESARTHTQFVERF